MSEQQKQTISLDLPCRLGDYTLIRSLGKGGMGEVFLAEDMQCKRMVALKRIRAELQKFPSIRRRFLREARIAARLSHPAIISIFSISDEPENSFYTMPYIKGLTLKEIIKEARQFPHKSSISHLIRIFLTICQAVAYSHSKKILHRDLKPENVIIGKFGEIIILDWGLAEIVGDIDDLKSVSTEQLGPSSLTRPGKIVGTLAYLAPERALGQAANEQTDVYALGAILFQILTFKAPFKRGNLELFQKQWKFEKIPDPIELAPDRDIPAVLSKIALKALEVDPHLRYATVNDLMKDIEAFIEGKPDWTMKEELSIDCKEQWEFEELILLSKFMAISHNAEMEWVNLMISQASFLGNIRLETTIELQEGSQGIGFLIGLPSAKKRKDLMEGLYLWIGSSINPGCHLFRNNITVLSSKELALQPHNKYQLAIEKNDQFIKLYIDQALCLTYHLPLPLPGTKIGILRRDTNHILSPLQVYTGSQNAQVSCLAIPDTFFLYQEYDKAVSEYKKIELSFAGRAEGREATYKIGTTLIQKALYQSSHQQQDLLNAALDQFGLLRATPMAPFEFLGKSLVYAALQDWEEESKCLELALRRYPKNGLSSQVVDHIAFRLHEASSHHRIAAYFLTLLAMRQAPQIFTNPEHSQILTSIQKEWEFLPYFPPPLTALQLAFLLGYTAKIVEMITEETEVEKAYFALLELGEFDLILQTDRWKQYLPITQAITAAMTKNFPPAADCYHSSDLMDFLFYQQFDDGKIEYLFAYASTAELKLTALITQRRFREAFQLLETFSFEQKMEEKTLLFVLFGCYLWAVEGEEIATAHFASVNHTLYPPYPVLLAHKVLGKIDPQGRWGKQALLWEKISLLRQQLVLAYALDIQEQIQQLQHELQMLKKNK